MNTKLYLLCFPSVFSHGKKGDPYCMGGAKKKKQQHGEVEGGEIIIKIYSIRKGKILTNQRYAISSQKNYLLDSSTKKKKPYKEASENIRGRGQGDFKRQSIREFIVTLCHPITSNATL